MSSVPPCRSKGSFTLRGEHFLDLIWNTIFPRTFLVLFLGVGKANPPKWAFYLSLAVINPFLMGFGGLKQVLHIVGVFRSFRTMLSKSRGRPLHSASLLEGLWCQNRPKRSKIDFTPFFWTKTTPLFGFFDLPKFGPKGPKRVIHIVGVFALLERY